MQPPEASAKQALLDMPCMCLPLGSPLRVGEQLSRKGQLPMVPGTRGKPRCPPYVRRLLSLFSPESFITS